MRNHFTRAFPLFLSLLPLFAIPSHAAEKRVEKKDAVVLMPLRPTKDIPQDEMTQYEAALVESLSTRYVVYSGQRVMAKVDEVYKKRSGEAKAGKECDETKCLQDVAIAFQTELVAVANIRKSGGGYSISLAINDVAEDKSVFSSQKSCKGCDEFGVADALKIIASGSTPAVAAPTAAKTSVASSGGGVHEGMVYVKQGNSGFYMDKTEVTQEAYQRDIGSNPSKFTGCPACPVEQVTWYEADAYCKKAGKRLPTDHMWGYAAASGGKNETYAGTNNESDVGEYAWYGKNSDMKTHPAGGKKPNGLGLYDMSGNVFEWTDSWDDNTGKKRVICGGSWMYPASFLRPADRIADAPGYRGAGIGFRCAR